MAAPRGILLLLALTVSACAEGGSGPALLWSVQPPETGTPSYLLGTMHIGVAAQEELPAAVWDAFDACARVTEEAEIRFIDAQEYLKLVSLPSGQLDQLLPDDVWIDLVTLLSAVSLERLRALRPWAAASLVFNELVPRVEGMDLTLLKEADARGKERVLLEVWQDQVNAMNLVPLQEDAAALTDLVRNRKQYEDRLAELIELYKAGDVEQLWARAPAAGAIPAPGTPYFDSFIVQRTRKWLPRLEQVLDSGSAFIAVGFGHVLGPQGLVATLSGKGYVVERVE